MPLSKEQRDELHEKYNGRCAYCGQPLGERWHADHVVAVFRGCGDDGGMLRPELDDPRNMLPSCAPCNLFKGTRSIEEFRKEIAAQVERARNYSVNYRTAERFGLVAPTGAAVVFYFEAVTAGHTPAVPEIPTIVKKKSWRRQLAEKREGNAGLILAALAEVRDG